MSFPLTNLAQLWKSDSDTVTEDLDQQEISHIADGGLTGTVSLALTSKVEFVPFLQPSPTCLPQRDTCAFVAEVRHWRIHSNAFIIASSWK